MAFKPTRLTKFDADRRALAESDVMQEFIDSPEADMFATGEPDQSGLLKEDDFAQGGDLTAAEAAFSELKKKVVEAPILRHFDSAKDVHIMLFANDWALSSTMIQLHNDKLHPVRFCGRVLKENEINYHPAEKEEIALLQLVKIAASAHLPSTTVNIADYTGMNNGVIAALQRGVSDLIIVGDSRLAIQQYMGVIACRKDALQVELARHKELTKKLDSVRYLHVVRHYNSAADSMATEALEAKAGRAVLSTERKAELRALNKIPEMLYACKNSADTRGNSADGDRNSADDGRNSAGANENSAKAAEEPSVTTRHETEFGGNQDIAKRPVELGEVRTPDANDLDPLVIQAERRQRISKAQDEELRWADLKAYLKGEFTQLSHRRAHNTGKVADEFVLSEDGLLYRLNKAKRPEELGELGLTLRLVVPTTMIDEVLQNCHNSIEGGYQGIVRTYHRVKTDYFWIGLYADVVKRVRSCEDCSTSKSKPHLKGYPPGNVMSERHFHVVSLDFVIPIPRTRRGNTALLLFQDHFTGFVIAKAMSETGGGEGV
ncbi:unnamed protein product [Phytophthora fragariaefolia]|uniref:Unnamed protein product n=1 Tax=Phytophthora fragariaefolia TaxID=1490495 RepID=A0A9W6U6R2_9STRA|nr:unnamed protein product [Phytophthora fragariaefolia]